jgi:hypothetical protein
MPGIAVILWAQASAPGIDAGQVSSLIERLCNHSITPADAFDPNLNHPSGPETCNTSGPLPTNSVLLKLRVRRSLEEILPLYRFESATMPKTVALDTDATARFVKRNGVWYFSNFDFMSWPNLLVAVLVVGIVVGLGYATTALVLFNRLMKNGLIGTHGIKMFIPFFWPALFRQTR